MSGMLMSITNVRFQPFGLSHGLAAIQGFPAHFPARMRLKYGFQPAPDHIMIVCN
jgi:hypothetical protein